MDVTAHVETDQRHPEYGGGRDALLAAAIRVVARGGPRKLTYRSVAAEAGVTHRLVVHHFGCRSLAMAPRGAPRAEAVRAVRQYIEVIGSADDWCQP